MSAAKKKVSSSKINPQAATRKKVETSESQTKAKKGEQKETFISLTGEAFKKLHEKTTKPLWNSIKGGYSKVSDKIKNRYESEKETYKSIGFWRYLMDITGRISLKVAKLGAVVTIAFLLDSLAMTYGGFSILDPYSVAIALGLGVLAIVIGSVLSQKDEGAKVSAKTVGSHVMEGLCAA